MFTESEFNKAMAELEGHKVYENSNGYYYNDLNQLMPLAWKHKLDLDYHVSTDSWRCESKSGEHYSDNKNPITAVRYCLWLIHKENSK